MTTEDKTNAAKAAPADAAAKPISDNTGVKPSVGTPDSKSEVKKVATTQTPPPEQMK